MNLTKTIEYFEQIIGDAPLRPYVYIDEEYAGAYLLTLLVIESEDCPREGFLSGNNAWKQHHVDYDIDATISTIVDIYSIKNKFYPYVPFDQDTNSMSSKIELYPLAKEYYDGDELFVQIFSRHDAYLLRTIRNYDIHGQSFQISAFDEPDFYKFWIPYLRTKNTVYIEALNDYCRLNNNYLTETTTVFESCWKRGFNTRYRELFDTFNLLYLYNAIKGFNCSEDKLIQLSNLVDTLDLRKEPISRLDLLLSSPKFESEHLIIGF